MKKELIIIVLVIALIIVTAGFSYYYGTQRNKIDNSSAAYVTAVPETYEDKVPTTEPTSIGTVIPTPTASSLSSWTVYTNDQYGFEISYPPGYKALSDEENLYGWENAVVLFYKGGQSYDLVVQKWDTEEEYKNSDLYKNAYNQEHIKIKKVGTYYFTLFNNNGSDDVNKIIKTFKSI